MLVCHTVTQAQRSLSGLQTHRLHLFVFVCVSVSVCVRARKYLHKHVYRDAITTLQKQLDRPISLINLHMNMYWYNKVIYSWTLNKIHTDIWTR